VDSAGYARVTPLGYGTYASRPIADAGYQAPPDEQPTVDRCCYQLNSSGFPSAPALGRALHLSVIAKLEAYVFFEIVVKELISAPVVTVDRKNELRLAIVVVVARIDQPHSAVQERNFV
jgi:hypothetical protein